MHLPCSSPEGNVSSKSVLCIDLLVFCGRVPMWIIRLSPGWQAADGMGRGAEDKMRARPPRADSQELDEELELLYENGSSNIESDVEDSPDVQVECSNQSLDPLKRLFCKIRRR
jgi:hypothetical protein